AEAAPEQVGDVDGVLVTRLDPGYMDGSSLARHNRSIKRLPDGCLTILWLQTTTPKERNPAPQARSHPQKLKNFGLTVQVRTLERCASVSATRALRRVNVALIRSSGVDAWWLRRSGS